MHHLKSNQREGFEKLQANDKLILQNQIEQEKRRALDRLKNQKWFQSLDETGKNLLEGQEQMLHFNFLRFQDQERMLKILDENDKKLLKNQDKLVEQQMIQFLRNEEWFQRLDEQNQNLTIGQSKIMALEFDQLLYLENLEEGQARINANQVKLHLEQQAYLNNLDKNDRKLFVGQALILINQEEGKQMISSIASRIETLELEIKKTQIISLYGDAFLTLDECSHKFNIIYDNQLSSSVSDYVLTEFQQLAGLGGPLESSIVKIQKMMIGNHPLLQQSVYEVLGGEFCNPKSHEYFMSRAFHGLLMRSTALVIDGYEMDKNEENRFVLNSIKATEAYITHCGCPNGLHVHYRKQLSSLFK